MNMSVNANILAVNSPLGRVGGPYVVIHKDEEERWALVALCFDGVPTLGIRWFWGSGGCPFARHATWFILPSETQGAMLDRLCKSVKDNESIRQFLSRTITGDKLKQLFNQ